MVRIEIARKNFKNIFAYKKFIVIKDGKKYFKKSEFDKKYNHNLYVKKILLMILRWLYEQDSNILKNIGLYKKVLDNTNLKDKIAIKIIKGFKDKYKDDVIDICNFLEINCDKIFLYDLKGENEYYIKFIEQETKIKL